MKKFAFTLAAIAAATLSLGACSQSPAPGTAASAVPPAPAAQPGQPPCGTTCKPGYIGLQLAGLASFSTIKQKDLRIPLMAEFGEKNESMAAGKSGKLPITATADWWTGGGTLRISAGAGTPVMSWSPFGDKTRDMSPTNSVKIPAGWYYSYITCSTARCQNVAVSVDGKPVVPYYIQPRQ